MHYFLLGDDVFALMPWMVKPYSRRQLTHEERIANYRISRGRRGIENAFEILVSQFKVLLGTMEQRPRVVRDIVCTSKVLHNMRRTHRGGANRAQTPANDVAALQNEQAVYEQASSLPKTLLPCFVIDTRSLVLSYKSLWSFTKSPIATSSQSGRCWSCVPSCVFECD